MVKKKKKKKSTCNEGDLVLSLGWEDPLEKGIATHSSIAWRIAIDRGAWQDYCSLQMSILAA